MSSESGPSGKFDPPPEVLRAFESMRDPATMRNAEQLEAATMAMMKAVLEHAEIHPLPDQDLEDERTARVAARDWPEVLGCIGRLSANAAARGENHQVYRHQQTLSQYLFLTGERDAAREAARRATEAARRMDGISILIGLALLNESGISLETGNPEQAIKLIEEGLEQIGSESYASLARARALVVRARCRIELGDLAAAESDLKESWPVFDRLSDSFILVGIQAKLAGWHEARARLHWARGERTEAIKCQRSAVTLRRVVLAAPQVEDHVGGVGLANSLSLLVEFLEGAGEADAGPVREERDGILASLKFPPLPRSLR